MTGPDGSFAASAAALVRALEADLHPDADGRFAAPDTAALYERIRSRPVVGFADLGVEGARDAVRRSVKLQGDPPPMEWIYDEPAGPLPARIYRPPAATGLMLVYVHGGGWVTGDLETTDTISRQLAAATGATVVSLDYPLSPESRHPRAEGKVVDSLLRLASRRAELGLDRRRLAVLGDSAGGYLATRAALRTDVVTHLVVYYPVVRPPHPTEPPASWQDNAKDPVLDAASMRWFWSQYTGLDDLSEIHSCDDLDLLALHGGPPERALVVTAQLDLLHDEGVALSSNLRARGCQADHVDLPGTGHGFLSMAGAVTTAAEVVNVTRDWLADR